MLRHFKVALVLMGLATTNTIMAQQSNPTVEIVLSQANAMLGDIVTADVFIRGAINVGGADAGISVDEGCLQILDSQPGGFLPTTGEEGGFSPFAEFHDHDARLAASITDRSKIANGDGVQFRVQLRVTCHEGRAPLRVTFAELTGVVDPTALEPTLVSYTLDNGGINTINTALTIGAQSQDATGLESESPNISIESQPAAGVEDNTNAATVSEAAQSSAEAENVSQGQFPWIILVVLTAVGGLFLGIVFRAFRRTPGE